MLCEFNFCSAFCEICIQLYIINYLASQSVHVRAETRRREGDGDVQTQRGAGGAGGGCETADRN